ncbi:VOC family protein [Actinomadura madurae]|uniref:VOC family protein n=1 Tax=Actinomadura madurae TaxID=1993 RepID=UPI0020D202A6|nr:VOC family protein [Actinomadura madurae]MCP9984841.1 VOC family protein [Actinomadura madurae]MCQ0021028.1 VOC family protein [Actinomadura madurae]
MHRLTGITMGVPDVAATAAYYTEFGLTPAAPEGGDKIARFRTQDGGEQLTIRHADLRRLLDLGIGVDDADDLDRIARGLRRLDLAYERSDAGVTALDPGTGVKVSVSIASRTEPRPDREQSYNAPGRPVRTNERADGVTREGPVKPRRLGHVVLGSTDYTATERFFIEGLGFKVSDLVSDVAAFLRCSTDHHNVLVQKAPVSFLHHTSWIVDDVDEIGRGAHHMLAADPSRHVWGLGGTPSARTSSGTSRTRPATSPSTAPTSTASSTTRCGSRRCGRAFERCTRGVRRPRRPSSPPTTSPS